MLTQYLTSLTEQQLVNNTLTGFLINLLRMPKNRKIGLTLEDIIESVAPVYGQLRRPSGQLYSSSESQNRNNIHRRVKCALSANGLFENFDRPIVNTTGVKRKGKTLNKKINLPTVNVWRVKEPQASDYLQQEIVKFVSSYFI